MRSTPTLRWYDAAMPDSSPAQPPAIGGDGTSVAVWREADHAVDAAGLGCPEPLMVVRNKVRAMASGETVAIVSTDPTTVRDFTHFCRFMGHELAFSERAGERFFFVIRKG